MFELGMSWNSVINSTTLKLESWEKRTNWYSGYWGVQDSEMKNWLNDKHPEIKQFKVNVLTGYPTYKLGDIEFSELDLAFYNNKLVAVYYEFGYNVNDTEILNHYIQKYGEGIGSYYSSYWSNGLSGDDYACDITINDIRQWKNEKVTLQYTHDERHLSYPKKDNKRGLYLNDEYYLVYDEVGYAAFEKTLNKAKEEYKEKKNDEHSQSLNSL